MEHSSPMYPTSHSRQEVETFNLTEGTYARGEKSGKVCTKKGQLHALLPDCQSTQCCEADSHTG